MKKYAFGLFITVILGSLGSCTVKTNTEETPAENVDENALKLTKIQFSSSDMKLGKMESQAFHEVIRANGMFDVPPENQATISTYFAGTVKGITLLPGERVKKGQVLFVLENPEYVHLQQEYLEAKGQLTYLKSDYERQKNLAEDNVTSQKNFLKAESEYMVTRVKLESLAKKLNLMGINPQKLTMENIRTTITIYSPISGYVTHVNIARGAFLNPSQTAIEIVDTDHIHVELNIFEKDLPKIRIGQEIEFRLHNDESHQYQAFVHLVEKTVDPEKRTIGIHGHLKDESLSSMFTPGMYIEAEIFTKEESKLSLPVDAIVAVENKSYVLVLNSSTKDGYTFMKKEVKTGSSNKNYVEILNTQDFKENTEFLVQGAFNLITE